MLRNASCCSLVYVASLSILAGAMLGCGSKSDRPPLGYVTGTVKLDGQALPDATVFFSPDKGGRTSFGQTDAQGKYKLSYVGAEQGATLGSHVIRVTTSQEVEDSQTGRTIHTVEKVPDRYNDHSELTREVASGNNTVDLDLQSK